MWLQAVRDPSKRSPGTSISDKEKVRRGAALSCKAVGISRCEHMAFCLLISDLSTLNDSKWT